MLALSNRSDVQPTKGSRKLRIVKPRANGSGSDNSHVITYERLWHGQYYADFRRDKRLYPEVYHCIVQREGHSEILAWTQHVTLESAIAFAEDHLRRLADSENVVSGGPPTKARVAK